jgi:hypothetical protein
MRKILARTSPGTTAISFITHSCVPWTSTFNFVPYDPTKTYDPAEYAVWADQYDNDWYKPLEAAGFKIIKDYLWDCYIEDTICINDNVLELRADNWIWINEFWSYTRYGYKEKIPQHNKAHPPKFMLMLMHLARDTRDMVFERTRPFLDTSLFSYCGRGYTLEGDMEIDPSAPMKIAYDRYYNPDWYSNTCFSMVVETMVEDKLFISEKSFKPFAFKHPFITFGCPGTLQYLRDRGFKTFDHILDESYDSEPNIVKNVTPTVGSLNRLNKIISVLNNLHTKFIAGEQLFGDPESLACIQHNHERFFDQELVNSMFEQEIVMPIRSFLSAP